MMKIYSLLVLTLLLGCKSVEPKQQKATAKDMILIAKGDLHGSGAETIKKSRLIISNKTDWQSLLSKMDSVNGVTKGFTETAIDFSKYTVIAVFEDVKTSGGYVIDLKPVDSKDQITIEVIVNGPNGMATSVMTQPYYIAKIAKVTTPIVFK